MTATVSQVRLPVEDRCGLVRQRDALLAERPPVLDQLRAQEQQAREALEAARAAYLRTTAAVREAQHTFDGRFRSLELQLRNAAPAELLALERDLHAELEKLCTRSPRNHGDWQRLQARAAAVREALAETDGAKLSVVDLRPFIAGVRGRLPGLAKALNLEEENEL